MRGTNRAAAQVFLGNTLVLFLVWSATYTVLSADYRPEHGHLLSYVLPTTYRLAPGWDLLLIPMLAGVLALVRRVAPSCSTLVSHPIVEVLSSVTAYCLGLAMLWWPALWAGGKLQWSDLAPAGVGTAPVYAALVLLALLLLQGLVWLATAQRR